MSNVIIQMALKAAAEARQQQAKFKDISEELTRCAAEAKELPGGHYSTVGYHYDCAAVQIGKVAEFWDEVANCGDTPALLQNLEFTMPPETKPFPPAEYGRRRQRQNS